ncbi:Uracil-DNA glycosylase, family 4 [Desulfosarcina cetonica]|nr:Uracil-DNA glycosylase, family 4 [Desulfosarcina cetonica]
MLLEAWRKDICEWLPVRDKWHEDYRKGCAFQMEEAGRYHPDNMLPDGRIRSDL